MNETQTIVTATKYGKRTDLAAAVLVLKERFTVTRHPEAIQISTDEQVAFLFASGVLVNWNNPEIDDFITQHSQSVFITSHSQPVIEQFEYRWNKTFDIEDDIILTPQKPKVLLSVSYAIAKSVQLDYNEQQITGAMELVERVPSQLATKGKTPLRGKRIRRLIGTILETQFAVNVSGIVEDKPELFWEEPRLSKYYTKMTVYLELEDRWYVLNEKLQLLHNTLEILRDEVNTKQSHALEWAIIWLIVVELFVAFGEQLFR